jgi:hypothetical protein
MVVDLLVTPTPYFVAAVPTCTWPKLCETEVKHSALSAHGGGPVRVNVVVPEEAPYSFATPA